MKSYISFNISIKQRPNFVNYKNGTNNSYSDGDNDNNSNDNSNIGNNNNDKGDNTKKIYIQDKPSILVYHGI